MLIDDVLPGYDVRAVHSIDVAAPAQRVFAAVRDVTVAEAPLASLLLLFRGIRASRKRAIFEELPERYAVLAEEPGRELVIGGIAQPWRPAFGVRTGVDFRTFDEPGYAKIAVNFAFDGGRLSTETRVALTDDAARRKFARYWLVVRPGSALVRRSWLRAIKRRAEGARSVSL